MLVPADETYDLLYPDGYTPAIETLTNVLRLRKTTDDNEDWGDAMREAFDIIDMSIAAARLMNEDIITAPVGSVVLVNARSESFILSSSAYSEERIGVTLDPILIDTKGLVKVAGHAYIRTTGSVGIGDYLYTSIVKGVAQASFRKRSGVFAMALTEPDGNAYVRAILTQGIADSPVQVLQIRVPATAAGTEWEISIMRAERDLEISRVHAIMDVGVTGDEADFCELSLRNKANLAEINDFVFTLTVDATAFVPVDFGVPDAIQKGLSEGDVVALKKTDFGAGLALPAFTLRVEYIWV